MKKIIFLLTFFLISIYSPAQTYIKGNAMTALVLVPNIGIETSIGKQTTFQVDALASFWKSFNDQRMQFYTLTAEVRYHLNEKYNGLYVGGNTGVDRYKLQKWNYWNTNKYEDGFGYRFGATIGYEKKISNRFMLDFFVSGGWHQGFYHGYYTDGTPGRYEHAKHWNKSGEWLPYGGGVMISYKL